MITRLLRGVGRFGPVNQVNHTRWVAIVTPTDRPQSVRNRRVIELFCGVDISIGVLAFVIGLSQISSFSLSQNFGITRVL